MMRFAYPDFLWALALLPVYVALFALHMSWKRKALKRFGQLRILSGLMPDSSNAKSRTKFVLTCFAYIFLVVGLANPQIGSKYEEVKREGVDLIFALDVSRSMLGEDIRPNRLERAKQAIGKLLEKLGDDRLGIVIFAGDAQLQLPFTSDFAAAKLFLTTVNTGSIQSQGTAIGAAIRTSVRALPPATNRSRAIIVITDGENHEDNAVEEAKAARQAGITVHTLGIGSPDGSPIPDFDSNGQRIGFKKDQTGSTVISRMNPAMLKEIATAGGGRFVQGTHNDLGLEELFNQINSMQKSKLGTHTFTDYADRFQYFLVVALCLLLIEFFVSARKSAISKRINIFGTEGKS